jgi:hypothetical protein
VNATTMPASVANPRRTRYVLSENGDQGAAVAETARHAHDSEGESSPAA